MGKQRLGDANAFAGGFAAFAAGAAGLAAKTFSAQAGSHGLQLFGRSFGPVGYFLAVSGAVVVGLNICGFVVTSITKTHKVTDITGTGSFVASAWTTHAVACRLQGLTLLQPSKSLLVTTCVTLWGLRLGGYLFYRVMQTGEDKRLYEFFAKDDEPLLTGPTKYPLKLAGFWTAQSAWAWVCLLPVTCCQALTPLAGLGLISGLGLLGFVTGWGMEALADYQKQVFKNDPKNKGRFCDTGLYAMCRHPNYAGEILTWVSLYALAAHPSVWAKCPWVAASPLFVSFLLLYVSGVPTLEKSHSERYAKRDDEVGRSFRKYKAETNLLIPGPKKTT